MTPPSLDPKTRSAWLDQARSQQPGAPGMNLPLLGRLLWSAFTFDISEPELKALASALGKISWRTFLAAFALAAYGFLEFPDEHGRIRGPAAFADEEDVKREVDAKLKPVKESLEELKAEVGEVKREARATRRDVNDVHLLILEREIKERARQYCAAAPNSDQRRLANAAIRDLQRQYRRINAGVIYEVPLCSDL